jgi:hypothetical protein
MLTKLTHIATHTLQNKLKQPQYILLLQSFCLSSKLALFGSWAADITCFTVLMGGYFKTKEENTV